MNIPSIPDSFNKIVFLLGIVIGAYSFLQIFESNNVEKEQVDIYNSLNDSLSISEFKLNAQEQDLLWESGALADRYKILNPLKKNDSTILFTRITLGSKNVMSVNDTINKWYRSYKWNLESHRLKVKLIENKRKALDESIEISNDREKDYNILLGVSLFLLGASVVSLLKRQNLEDEIKKRELNNTQPYYEECQSCGKNFSAMIQNGSNKDNTPSIGFCKSCFLNGEFVVQTDDVDLFINQALISEVKSYKPRKRKKIIKNIKSLERWKRKY